MQPRRSRAASLSSPIPVILITISTSALVVYLFCPCWLGFASDVTQSRVPPPLTPAPEKKTISSSEASPYCNLPDSDQKDLLNQPHGSSPWAKRYYFRGAWHMIHDLQVLLKDVKEESVCVVLSIANDVPCPKSTCLLPVHLRPGTSDASVAEQLFDKNEYSFMAKYKPKTLLDGGGNVGLAALIFATMWPDARIISVEASSKNYRALQRNVAHLKNVTPVHAGLWWKTSKLKLIKGNRPNPGQEWQFMVEEVDEATAPEELEGLDVFTGVTVDFLLELFNLPGFDIAKVDVEGSEREVFMRADHNRLRWIEKTKVLAVEIHDDMKAGAQAAVYKGIQEIMAGKVSVEVGPEYHVFESQDRVSSVLAAS